MLKLRVFFLHVSNILQLNCLILLLRIENLSCKCDFLLHSLQDAKFGSISALALKNTEFFRHPQGCDCFGRLQSAAPEENASPTGRTRVRGSAAAAVLLARDPVSYSKPSLGMCKVRRSALLIPLAHQAVNGSQLLPARAGCCFSGFIEPDLSKIHA